MRAYNIGKLKRSVIVNLLQAVVIDHIRNHIRVIKAIVILSSSITMSLHISNLAPCLTVGAAFNSKARIVNLYSRSPANSYKRVVDWLCLQVDHFYRQRFALLRTVQPEFRELGNSHLHIVMRAVTAIYSLKTCGAWCR